MKLPLQSGGNRSVVSGWRRWAMPFGLLALVEWFVMSTDLVLKPAPARAVPHPRVKRALPALPVGPVEVRPIGSEFVSIRRGEDVELPTDEASLICRLLQQKDDTGQTRVDSLVGGCTYRIELVSLEVVDPLLPADLDGLRVVQLSDIHIGRYITVEETRKMAQFAASLQPDLLLLTGDFAFHPSDGQLAEGLEPFGQVAAPLGRYASLGNHDYWDDVKAVREALAAAGITVLHDANCEIVPGLWLAGLDDLLAAQPDLRSALAGIPAEATTILMSHNPNVLPEVAERPLLVLSGHTHGGQIRFPWQRALPIDEPNFFSQLMIAYEMTGYYLYGGNRAGVGMWRYLAGLFHEGRAWMYVSRGLGVTRPPIRYDCPAEITLFTFRSGVGG